ncbi:hypothetical protein, partial [Salmonella sp. s60093]|uniref:hypothetical protein n=1 Tax=Salmonella sp. s60093 TaxID=3159721 RepID=UPI00397FB1B2
QSYHELKILLLHAGDLIRTKSNWGTKSSSVYFFSPHFFCGLILLTFFCQFFVEDNVIDLTITILNLQDTVTPLYKHRDGGPKSYAYKEVCLSR